MIILTIDTGTTNTRVTLWQNSKPVAIASRQVGVRDTAVTGNKAALQNGVRETINEVLTKAKFQITDVNLVLASGMITSNVGLHEVPHLTVPVDIAKLAKNMVQANVPEVCELPIWFIPGVRNFTGEIGLHNCEMMDMMRGEEVEVMSLISRLNITEPTVVVLPGSHSKFVYLNEKQQITGCATTLAGELLHVITHSTILANALDSDFAHSVNEEMLFAGAKMANKIGFGRACFTVRILDQFTIYERNARANFLLGAVLASDLLTIKNSEAMCANPSAQFVIAGKPLLREALSLLIQEDEFFSGNIIITNEEQQAHQAGFGSILVAHTHGLMTSDVHPSLV